MKRIESHIFTGMQRDLSAPKHPAQFLYDGRNIRLTAREGNTMFTVTNEKGTADTDITVSGDYIGHCLLNNFLVVFSVNNATSYITRIDLDNVIGNETNTHVVLFSGNLGFLTSYQIDAVGSFESDKIQKVYWTDGYNQPRMINIVAERFKDGYTTDAEYEYDTYQSVLEYTITSFDFVQTLDLNETVTVTKLLGATGTFSPGVIQYAFTYYNKYGQESAIFYTTPLCYISYPDRGASPEDTVSCAFKITVTDVDTKFKFLRIYSIQRTAINGTPYCKRIQDINIDGITNVSYIDTGTSGNTVDPVELLYKGGESITAGTIEQKDNTLFFGDLEIQRNLVRIDANIKSIIQSVGGVSVYRGLRSFTPYEASVNNYIYYNQLTSYNSSGNLVPCGGFKYNNLYRLGVQFQHKTGIWSDPIELSNSGIYLQNQHPTESSGTVSVPIFKGVLNPSLVSALNTAEYIRVRPVMVIPGMQDRSALCQGVISPTLYKNSNNKIIYPSWFFRAPYTSQITDDCYVAPTASSSLVYTDRALTYNPSDIRAVEICGNYNNSYNPLKRNRFSIYWNKLNLHSPDIEFNNSITNTNFSASSNQLQNVGVATVSKTFSDINIQTETPCINNASGGFVHQSAVKDGMNGIVSGLFYDDFLVDESKDSSEIRTYPEQHNACKWMIFLWHKSGSLNNDINRPANKGVASSILKKKVISNLRFSNTTNYYYTANTPINPTYAPQICGSNDYSIAKQGDFIYRGEVNILEMPDSADGNYFAFQGEDIKGDYSSSTSFSSTSWWKTFATEKTGTSGELHGIWKHSESNGSHNWENQNTNLGDGYLDLVIKKDPVRIKYRTTPHLLFTLSDSLSVDSTTPGNNSLYIFDVRQTVTNPYGGNSTDALRENTWIPCGEPVKLSSVSTIYINTSDIVVPEETSGATAVTGIVFEYSYGDTYYQRYDCLKTYPYTTEDENQLVEIGSFMLETYVNIDGRYDRNRGQLSNLNMTPQNFNLLNPVYSQMDNFFSYKIQDDDYYKNTSFPNQITWTKEKQSGADVDMWTNLTLSSVYDMDGSKGEVVSLNTYKDQIFCFQKKGVSNILFNSRVQIPASDGVPIEITNGYKVDGYRYISDGIGCNDKKLVKETPMGIYFVDSVSNHLFHIGEGLTDVTTKCNLAAMFKAYTWDKLLYDDINHDLYLVNGTEALCYSETLQQFTGFFDYADISLVETRDSHVFTMKDSELFKMFEGDYCDIFRTQRSWGLTFISNGLNDKTVAASKTFTNLEFRANVEGDGEYNSTTEKFTEPYLPFDSLETWNDYQHGIANLQFKQGSGAMQHHLSDDTASLNRKFRIWRCDIPRDNAEVGTTFEQENGITRFKTHVVDRMRNPWLFLKLGKNTSITSELNNNTALFTYSDVIKNATSLRIKGDVAENNTVYISAANSSGIPILQNSIEIAIPHTLSESEFNEVLSWQSAKLHIMIDGTTDNNNIIIEKGIRKTEIHDIQVTYYD